MKKALYIQNSLSSSNLLEAKNVAIALQLNSYDYKSILDSEFNENLNYLDYSIILIDQLAFNCKGLSKALEIETRLRDSKNADVILTKSNVLTKNEKRLLIDSNIILMTKPLLATSLARKINSLDKA
tara:strand:- start:630 stop:1010 length:381 start_codon:yes stop_codon:yes gene_type:complete